MDQNLIFIFLVMISAGSLFYALFYPSLSGAAAMERRQSAFTHSKQTHATDRLVDQTKRRQQIIENLKDVDGAKKRKASQTVAAKLIQAGLYISMKIFIIASVVVGLVVGGIAHVFYESPLISAGATLVGGFGVPRWFLNVLIKKRKKKFLEEFPTSVDIIIRGVKAGLPIGQCLGIIAAEAAEPVRGEFQRIIEAQSIGLSVGEAVERLPERMPLPEASFFSIVINLQQKSGGNLSEALGNLSRVLRERKKMRNKIIAMSSEAKASAMIIGALPFVVAFFVWLSSPDYIMLLFTTSTGKMVLGICAVWMSCGVFVMRRLINFDF